MLPSTPDSQDLLDRADASESTGESTTSWLPVLLTVLALLAVIFGAVLYKRRQNTATVQLKNQRTEPAIENASYALGPQISIEGAPHFYPGSAPQYVVPLTYVDVAPHQNPDHHYTDEYVDITSPPSQTNKQSRPDTEDLYSDAAAVFVAGTADLKGDAATSDTGMAQTHIKIEDEDELYTLGTQPNMYASPEHTGIVTFKKQLPQAGGGGDATNDAEIKALKVQRRQADDADDEDEVERLSEIIKALRSTKPSQPRYSVLQQLLHKDESMHKSNPMYLGDGSPLYAPVYAIPLEGEHQQEYHTAAI